MTDREFKLVLWGCAYVIVGILAWFILPVVAGGAR